MNKEAMQLMLDAVKGYVAKAMAPLQARLEAVESRSLERGEQGAQGEKGERGEKGDQGEKGTDGIDGTAGKDGEPGAEGIQGKAGETGARGAVGEKGDAGIAGTVGARGEKGESGIAGPRGEKGDLGLIGKDGREGKDGRDGADGNDGADGRDAVAIEFIPLTSLDKRFARGTFATFRGGIIRAFRNTEPMPEGGNLEAAGWVVCMRGIHSEMEELLDEGRTIKRTTFYTDGEIFSREHKTAMALYRGVWREGNYETGDTVTRGGSVWHCQYPTHDVPGTGSQAWKLMVKEGARGKDGIVQAERKPQPVKL